MTGLTTWLEGAKLCFSRVSLLGLLIFTLASEIAVGNEPRDPAIGPPLKPDGETVASDDAFVADFLSKSRPSIEEDKITLSKTMLTNTKQWGFVLRADFIDRSDLTLLEPGRINRLIAWKDPNGRYYVTLAYDLDLPGL